VVTPVVAEAGGEEEGKEGRAYYGQTGKYFCFHGFVLFGAEARLKIELFRNLSF
jgi:hypothetical protein